VIKNSDSTKHWTVRNERRERDLLEPPPRRSRGAPYALKTGNKRAAIVRCDGWSERLEVEMEVASVVVLFVFEACDFVFFCSNATFVLPFLEGAIIDGVPIVRRGDRF